MRPLVVGLLGLVGCVSSPSPMVANTTPAKTGVAVVRLDAPPWTAGTRDVQLTWEIAADTDHSSPALEIRVGSVLRTLELGEQQGRIYPGSLSACERGMGTSGPDLEYLARTGELAKMTLVIYDADMRPTVSTSFTVRHAADGILEVWKVRGKTGECPPGDCSDRTMFAIVPVPSGTISEALEDRSNPSWRFSCGGDDGMNQ